MSRPWQHTGQPLAFLAVAICHRYASAWSMRRQGTYKLRTNSSLTRSGSELVPFLVSGHSQNFVTMLPELLTQAFSCNSICHFDPLVYNEVGVLRYLQQAKDQVLLHDAQVLTLTILLCTGL